MLIGRGTKFVCCVLCSWNSVLGNDHDLMSFAFFNKELALERTVLKSITSLKGKSKMTMFDVRGQSLS